MRAVWPNLKDRRGRPLFKPSDLAGSFTRPTGWRLIELLKSVGRAYTYPPSLQPPGTPLPFVNGFPYKRLTPDRIDPTETPDQPRGSISNVLYTKVNSAITMDVQAMRASCGDSSRCKTCRLPEDEQPDEPLIFLHDVVYWWNACRGRCMSAKCRRGLIFHTPGKGGGIHGRCSAKIRALTMCPATS